MTMRWIATFACVGVALAFVGCGDDRWGGRPDDRTPAQRPAPPAQPGPCLALPGVICTVAGTGIAGDGADGLSPLATNLYSPADVAFDDRGLMFVVDWNNHRIRAIGRDGALHVVAGAGELLPETGTDQDLASDRLNHPTDVTFAPDGRLVIAAWHNSRVKTVNLDTGELTDTCGNGKRGFSGDGGPAREATLNLPASVVFDAMGNLLISDQANQRIRRVDHYTGLINTVAGSGMRGFSGDGGSALEASFNLPVGQGGHPAAHITLARDGSIYLADTDNQRIRLIDASGIVFTVAGNGTAGFAGDGGPAAAAQLNGPVDVALGPDGALYIADTENNCVRVVRAGVIETAVGTCHSCREFASADCTCAGIDPQCVRDGVPARQTNLRRPTGIAFDATGALYVADSNHHRIRKIQL